MLGRLFKQNPTNSLNSHHHHYSNGLPSNANSPSPSVPNATNASSINNPNLTSFDDSYAREILYGTHNPNQLKPYQFNHRFFRIVIAQDGGSLRSKQVLYDSSINEPTTPSPASSVNTINTTTTTSNNPFKASPTPVPSSSSSSSSSTPLYTKNHPKTIIPSKVYHNANELNDYMFGCGLPSNEIHCSTKVHVLPPINNLIGGPYSAVLITRLFSICDVENTESSLDVSSLTTASNWNPKASLPIGATNIKKFPFFKNMSSATHHTTTSTSATPPPIIPTTTNTKSATNINSRFAIGVVIPLESLHDINDVIINNWDELSHFLILLQKLIYKKLLTILQNSCLYDNDNNLCSSSYLVNKRIQFPNYILQNELDLNNQVLKLIKLIHYDSNIPKLINTNSLMKSCLLNDNTQYNSVFLNWVLETLNWLEFKDGKSFLLNGGGAGNPLTNYNSNSSFHTTNHSFSSTDLASFNTANNNTFLASLLALLIPLRQSLSVKPYFNVTDSTTREVTRVVLMTGNPVVAKKLIFIINGIIPDTHTLDVDDYEVSQLEQKQQQFQSDHRATNTHNNGKSKPYDYDENDCSTSPKTKRPYPPARLPSTFSNTSNGSNNVTTPSSPAKSINPIPIKRSTQFSTSVGSSDNSFGKSSPKGWEIPLKSAVASTTTSTPNKENVGGSVHSTSITRGIPIALPITATSKATTSSSLSKSSSLAYLSSSLSSSYSSSYSLPKIGSSFMDKWKNSISSVYPGGGGVGGGSSSHHGNGSISSNYGYDGDYLPPPPTTTFGSIPKRNSIQSLRSPSPAIEQEEFNWSSHSATIPINHSGSMSSQNAIGGAMTNLYGSTPNKLSRTQSMYDLYNMNNEILEESYNEGNTLSNDNYSSSNSTKVSGNNNPSGNDNATHNSTLNKNLAIKRSKTSIYSPLIDDKLVKNVSEHNKTVIQSKCVEIMKLKFQDAVSKDSSKDHILEIQPIIHNEKNYVDIDEAESIMNDQSTITSGIDNLDLASVDSGGLSSHPIFKHLALSPNVAFSDEFRPEFNIQSCPVNPKLENQVLSAMKSDLQFYQNNFEYKKVVSRTVFISLRAREIKLIEMSVDNESGSRGSVSLSAANTPKSETPGVGPSPHAISSSLTSPLGSYFPDSSTFHLRKHPEKPNNNAITKTLKVFTPTKNLGNLELINRVDNTFEEINQLFNSQQQYRTKQQQQQQQQQRQHHDKNDKGAEGFTDFNKRLSKLVLSLV